MSLELQEEDFADFRAQVIQILRSETLSEVEKETAIERTFGVIEFQFNRLRDAARETRQIRKLTKRGGFITRCFCCCVPSRDGLLCKLMWWLSVVLGLCYLLGGILQYLVLPLMELAAA